MLGKHHNSLWMVVSPLLVSMVCDYVIARDVNCTVGWFGDACQFQCHCQAQTLDCACDSTDCEPGWFGPGCQYVDEAYDVTATLTDADDQSCAVLHQPTQFLNFSPPVTFTWMRLVASTEGTLDGLTLTFLSEENDTPATTVVPVSRATVTKNSVMDVHGTFEEPISAIELHWPGYLCSAYVSGGRNVALRQRADQSEDHLTGTGAYKAQASNAVDGSTDNVFSKHSCTHTHPAPTSSWTLDFERPVMVDRYRIFNRHAMGCRLQHFQLTDTYEGVVQRFHNDTEQVQNVYDIRFDNATEVASVTVQLSTKFWPDPDVSPCGISEDQTVLTICEFQAFGDSVCEFGLWGLECEQECNCEVPTEPCYVSTGMCPRGCRAGYFGIGCAQRCEHGTWGIECNMSCNANCQSNACDVSSGACLMGCVPPYLPPLCVEKENSTDSPDSGCLTNNPGSSEEYFSMTTVILIVCAVAVPLLVALLIAILCVWRYKEKASGSYPVKVEMAANDTDMSRQWLEDDGTEIE